ncbi:hypothetical protein KKI24_06445, partial [bacterium]|nr:hypothetical protein [bacterium]
STRFNTQSDNGLTSQGNLESKRRQPLPLANCTGHFLTEAVSIKISAKIGELQKKKGRKGRESFKQPF